MSEENSTESESLLTVEANQSGESGESNQNVLRETSEATPSAIDQKVSEAESDSDWYWANEVPGKGDIPEWFNKEKYKSVEEQAKAQRELEKKFGAFTGAPEEYEFRVDQKYGDVEIDSEDPLLQGFVDYAKAANMSQEHFDNIFNMYVGNQLEYANELAQKDKEYLEEEVKKLGPTANQDLNVLQTWGKNNLPEELFPTFQELVNSADSVRLFNYIRQQGHSSANIPARVEPVPAMTHQELRAKMDPATTPYGRDIAYTKAIDAEYKRYFG